MQETYDEEAGESDEEDAKIDYEDDQFKDPKSNYLWRNIYGTGRKRLGQKEQNNIIDRMRNELKSCYYYISLSGKVANDIIEIEEALRLKDSFDSNRELKRLFYRTEIIKSDAEKISQEAKKIIEQNRKLIFSLNGNFKETSRKIDKNCHELSSLINPWEAQRALIRNFLPENDTADVFAPFIKRLRNIKKMTNWERNYREIALEAGIIPESLEEILTESNIHLSRYLKLKEEFKSCHVGLVFYVAKKYEESLSNSYLGFEDIISAGLDGLDVATERYKYQKGQFSTYGIKWIMQRIREMISTSGKGYSLPKGVVENIIKVAKSRKNVEQSNNGEATFRGIAENCGMPVESVKRLIRYSSKVLSLDATNLQKNTENSLYETFDGSCGKRSYDQIIDRENKEAVKEMLFLLNPREREIIELRYGLKDGNEYTLQQVADRFERTRERIRQIQDRALKKLRSPVKLRKVGYMKNDFF